MDDRVLPARLAKHLDALGAARGAPPKILEALRGVRADGELPEIHRDVLLRILAKDAALKYLEIAEGHPIAPIAPPSTDPR